MNIPLLLFIAHDFWLEPATFTPQPGSVVALRLRVGQEFMGDPVALDPASIKLFIADDGARRVRVGGRPGTDRGVMMAGPVAQVAAYESVPGNLLELDAVKFHAYLKEEGLESIIGLRQRAGKGDKAAREVFARCAKSLLRPGGAPAVDRTLGLTLELVQDKGPGDMKLLYQGKPLAQTLVVAMHKLDASKKQAMRSGPDGRVRFQLKEPGLWLIKAVHMIPATAGQDADWVSYWASVTLDIPKVSQP